MALKWERFRNLVSNNEILRAIANDVYEKAGVKINEEYLEFIKICGMVSSNPKEFSVCLAKVEHGIPIKIETKKGEREIELKDYGLLKQKLAREVILQDLENIEDVEKRVLSEKSKIEKDIKEESKYIYEKISKSFIT